MEKNLMKLYERTLDNCHFYYKNNDPKLISEIGCLRGIAYCLEELGVNLFDLEDLEFFINISNEYFN